MGFLVFIKKFVIWDFTQFKALYDYISASTGSTAWHNQRNLEDFDFLKDNLHRGTATSSQPKKADVLTLIVLQEYLCDQILPEAKGQESS